MKRLTVRELNNRGGGTWVNRFTLVRPYDEVYLVPIAATAPREAYSEPLVTVVRVHTDGVVTVLLPDGAELTTSGQNIRHRRPDRRENTRGGSG